MLVLLPPSETKRPGGRRTPLDLDRLALPGLRGVRERVVDALVALSADPETASRVLRLGPTQVDEVAVNAALATAPTLPAIDRYTGVLFDALEPGTLPAPERRWLGQHVLIHSAPFGPIGALDPIPAYRLTAGVAVPGLPPLRRLWADAVTAAIEGESRGFVLDLRSEAYVALGPVPATRRSAYVRVVAAGPDGEVRALNHFNKHAKGELVRALAEGRPRIRAVDDLVDWARGRGITLDGSGPGIVTLRVA
ncbi:peroxide stress protein YaaA [Microbacterium sp. X-17]|uniref:YaaA family protein n=1 Tax=Microbacterium sp. X-17 TaxID=3144404 RepID=UPI0031F4EB9B